MEALNGMTLQETLNYDRDLQSDSEEIEEALYIEDESSSNDYDEEHKGETPPNDATNGSDNSGHDNTAASGSTLS